MKHVLMHVFLESFDVGPVKDPHGFAGRAAACAAGGSVFKDPGMGNTACCQSEANDGVADAHVDAKPILESALPAAPFISGGDSEQERIYQVTLSKSPGQKLGLDVDYMAERKILPIMHITGGIAEEWNKKYPDRKLNSGDSILEVNGISGDVVEMLERCKADDTLKMKLCRCLTYEHLVEDLENLVRRKECGPIMVRLSWHDAGIYNGADGCPNAAMRLPGGGEHALAANAGLPQVAIPLLEPIAAKYVPRMISHADLWALAANVAIKVMGGPEIAARFGRLDAERVGDGASSATGRLPDGDKDARHLRDIFYPKGFDDKAIVALSGAHTVGSCHLDRSGFDGAWTADKLKFDNSYFKDLLHRSWSSETTSKGNPQFRCAESKTMMLTTVMASVIVVGGGLAGMSAANTVVELGGRTILLDKSSFCGGNSTKATSGINGAGTKTQKGKSIPDTAEIFIADTLKGGAKKPELAKVLCANSAADVDWLVDKFDLDLSLVARLGGHSQPRTHRGKERFPGMTISYALIQMLEKAEVYKLLVNAGTVVGCEYKKAGKTVKEFGPMVLASGGFGADFGADSLLATYRPDLLHLPTTNGEHCTGDAIKMGEAIGAATIDLEWVQVHPTGLVKPDDPDAKVRLYNKGGKVQDLGFRGSFRTCAGANRSAMLSGRCRFLAVLLFTGLLFILIQLREPVFDPETGAWTGVSSVFHLLSRKNGGLNNCASEVIRDIARLWDCSSFADYGAGTGAYALYMRDHGFETACVDGNPAVKVFSSNLCSVADLSKLDSTLPKADLVLSLEVAEHIPEAFQDAYMRNIANGARKGHVNCRDNAWVIKQFEDLGLKYEDLLTLKIRKKVESCPDEFNTINFKRTMMVFSKV
eukprot:s285_g2.t1